MSFRTEHKIAVSAGRLIDVNRWLRDIGATYLHDKRTVFSTYFDNDMLSMYHESQEGVVPRKKIRIRVYNETGDGTESGLLEMKLSSVEGRYKESERLDKLGMERCLQQGIFDNRYGLCRPVSQVRYSREYFRIKDTRVTLDTDIQYRRFGSANWIDDRNISMELKCGWNVDQNWLMQEFPFQRARFSKYSRACEFTLV